MARRVASCVYNINYLPNEVLCSIISLLPIKEAIRTSILSKRWRHLFTLMSNLDFEVHNNHEKEKLDLLLGFLDRLMSLQERPSIVRFRLSSYYKIDPRRVKRWICALVRNKVQELILGNHGCELNGLPLSECLFSCESLVVLNLNFFSLFYVLKVPVRVCLPHLKVLHFRFTVFPGDGSEDRLFSSCPVLEELVLRECFFEKDCVKFNVSNQNLKRLTLKSMISRGRGIVPILISAPSLVLLSYTISGGHSLEFIDVKSLAEVVFNTCVASRRFLTNASSALRSIQNIRTLEVSKSVLKVFKRYDVPIPLFDKLTCLRVSNRESKFDPICLEYFLAGCVVLETLVFEEPVVSLSNLDTGNQYSLRKSHLAPLLLHLKSIEIHLFHITEVEVLMSIIEFFLKNAEVLEKLKLCSKMCRPEQEVEIMRKLTSFPRASNKFEVHVEVETQR